MRLIDADALMETLKILRDGNKAEDESIETSLIAIGIQEAYCSAIEAVQDAPTIDAVPLWVSVKDRLPTEATGCVLVCMPKGKVRTGQYSEYSKQWYIGDMCGVGGDEPIAWMPLPEPPKEE